MFEALADTDISCDLACNATDTALAGLSVALQQPWLHLSLQALTSNLTGRLGLTRTSLVDDYHDHHAINI